MRSCPSAGNLGALQESVGALAQEGVPSYYATVHPPHL